MFSRFLMLGSFFRGKKWRIKARILWRWGNAYYKDVQSGWKKVAWLSSLLFSSEFNFHTQKQLLNSKLNSVTFVIRWSLIAGRIPGRTAEEIEKYWTSRYSTSEWIYKKFVGAFSLPKAYWGAWFNKFNKTTLVIRIQSQCEYIIHQVPVYNISLCAC